MIKRALILTAGLCWILAAVGIGTIHFIGFCLGAFLSFAVGVALCAYALVASQS